MKRNVKLLSLFIALLMLLPTLFSCLGTGNKDATLPETTAAVTEKPSVAVNVVLDNATEYILIRAEKASPVVLGATTSLREAILEKTGVSIAIKEDWVKDVSAIPENAKEIVIGNCNRPASQKLLSEINQRDYAIKYENERIIILGGTDEATAEAVTYFINNYIDSANKKITVQDNLRYYSGYTYFLGNISIDGIDLKQYSIVYPKNGTIYEKYAAENLAAHILKNTGAKLTINDDSTSEKQYEFLVGNTSRAASNTNVTPTSDQFVLVKTGDKIVMNGYSYMVGGAVGEFLNTYMSAERGLALNITTLPTQATAKNYVFKEAKNAILMIGDGMGFNHVEMALATSLPIFYAKDLPNKGSSTTNSLSSGYTDSAAAGTALATGYKTLNSYLGVDKNNNSLLSLRELANSKGAKTAILTTDALTGATPSAFLVHHKSRSDTTIIQNQINNVIKDKAVTYAKGSVDNSLIDETKVALSAISEGDNTFFAMIEGAYIDKHSHNNDKTKTIMAVTRFNDSVAYAMMFVLCNPDTMLIITADHETGGIVKDSATGAYKYTSTNHTTTAVPVYAFGSGTETFNDKQVDNIDISKFIAKVYTSEKFGQ